MIDFIDNKHGDFALSAIYFWRSVKHFGTWIIWHPQVICYDGKYKIVIC